AAFPDRADLIVVVIDAATPELAEQATAALTARLSRDSRHFRSVRRPDGGAFFDRAGLLFVPVDGVAQTTQALIAAQPLLGMLATDPSLRGLADALSLIAGGASTIEPARSAELARPLTGLADVLEAIVAGQSPSFSWRELISNRSAESRERRR